MEGAPKMPAEAEKDGAKTAKTPRRIGGVRAALAGLAAMGAVGAADIGDAQAGTKCWPVAGKSSCEANEVTRSEEAASKHREVLKGILLSHGVSEEEMQSWNDLGSARDEKYLNQAGSILLDKEWELKDKIQALQEATGEKTAHRESVQDSARDINELFTAAEKLATTSEDSLAQSDRLLRETYRGIRRLLEIAEETFSNQK